MLSRDGESVFADIWATVSGIRKLGTIPSATGAGGKTMLSALCL